MDGSGFTVFTRRFLHLLTHPTHTHVRRICRAWGFHRYLRWLSCYLAVSMLTKEKAILASSSGHIFIPHLLHEGHPQMRCPSQYQTPDGFCLMEPSSINSDLHCGHFGDSSGGNESICDCATAFDFTNLSQSFSAGQQLIHGLFHTLSARYMQSSQGHSEICVVVIL
jgi:hypothetical protein